jgi:pimeloyl-ACP methyl ester carboxylesterase
MQKTILFRQQNLVYKVSGTGLPVMLLHGFTEDQNIWDTLVNAFPEKYQWLVPDLPGSGKSDFNPSLEEIADFAAAVNAIRQEEQIQQMVVIGHSMGGYIALALAEKYPEHLKGFCLFHSTAYEDRPEKKESRLKSMEFIRKHGSSAYVRQSLPGLFSSHFKNNHPGIIQRQMERYANFNPDSLVQYLNAMRNRKDKTLILRNMKIPVMFLIGEEDPAVPLRDALEQCHLPEISYIHVLTHTAHMGMLENTNLCNSLIGRFLDEISK